MNIEEILCRATQIAQRTDAWQDARKYTIGGSSIATLLGIGFNDINTFLSDRLLPPPIVAQEVEDNDKIAMNWGTVFEDILANYVEKAYNCKIEGADSFFIGVGEYVGLSFSPDGLSYMEVEYDSYEEEMQTPLGLTVERRPLMRKELCLLEFKCPYSRALRGYMPEYYRPQVLMGLEFLGIKKGVFIEAAFRPCYIEQYDDSTDHAKEYCKRKFTKQYARGAIIVPGVGNIDLGYRPDLLASALGDIVRGSPHTWGDTLPTQPYKYVLCWKLLDIGRFEVEPKPILGQLMPKIRQVYSFMEEVRGLPPDEIARRIAAFAF